MESHCTDCCCAQSWAALGISAYDGKSIPEHIDAIRASLAASEARAAELKDLLRDAKLHINNRFQDELEIHDRIDAALCGGEVKG